MLAKRIIPCLDVTDGKVVKGVRFQNVKEVGSIADLALRYSLEGADELVLYNISASYRGQDIELGYISEVARVIDIPFTVGGGIRRIEDFGRVLRLGADKVSINSIALKEPEIIRIASDKYGSQCVVLSMDVKRVGSKYVVFGDGGNRATDLDAIEWSIKAKELGAGELVINSIDRDGTLEGFDTALLAQICESVDIPVIASGGAGGVKDFVDLFINTKVDGGLAASVFHSGAISIPKLKGQLKSSGINVREWNDGD